MRSTRLGRRWAVLTAVLVGAAVVALTPVGEAAARSGSTSTTCTRRKPCDTNAPSVTIGAPASGATVAGSVTVSGTASDDIGVSAVAVSVDGGSPLTAAGTTTWSVALDTTAYGDGAHTVTARATDAAGKAATASVTVTVDNVSDPAPPPPPPPPPDPTEPVAAPAMAPGTIGGWTFQETDRDGVYEVGETPLAGQHLFLYSGSGAYLGNTYSNASGWYQFTGRADGAYRVQYAPASWWAVRDDWVPDTTGSILPMASVQLSGTSRADMGWRPIVRSTDANAPITSYTGANGLVVQSYDDVVPAVEVYDALMQGSMVGEEAASVTVRFDFLPTGSNSTAAMQSNGVYTWYHATSYVPYYSWLDTGDRGLFHEYGHAWSLYYAHMVQQDPTLTAYLRARGVYGDPRLGSSYAWDPKEMIAEDYRQLFGTANAQGGGQLNTAIPPAEDVPGLRDFLATTFRTPPA